MELVDLRDVKEVNKGSLILISLKEKKNGREGGRESHRSLERPAGGTTSPDGGVVDPGCQASGDRGSTPVHTWPFLCAHSPPLP